MSQQLPRVMRLRDVVLFNISAIVGLRWLTTAASQFGLASLGLWLVAMVVFFLPQSDRKSTRLNSSHGYTSNAVFCLKKKEDQLTTSRSTTRWVHITRNLECRRNYTSP